MSLFGHGWAARAVWDSLRTSLWFIPAIMGTLGPVLTLGARAVDRALGSGSPDSFPALIYVSQPDQARELLTTILSSISTMASLVFSITMVVLTLAAGQFGPRLIRNFMARRQTQLVLGSFIMTIIYTLLLLSAIGPEPGDGPHAYASVTLAVGLAALCVGLLVLYIHHLARSIMSETLIEAVGRELDEGVRELPAHAGEEDPEEVLPEDFARTARHYDLGRFGHIQTIEIERIVEAAREAGVLVGLNVRAGDFAIRNGRTFGIHPPERATDALAATVAEAITLGAHRTPVQDLEYSIRHLVEIAVRALSPGINDPYTAISALHRLSAAWPTLMERGVPSGVFRDAEGRLRVVCPRSSYAALLNTSFSQIRQAGADKPIIHIHLLKAFTELAPCATTPELRSALRGEVEAVLEDARREINNSTDLQGIEGHGQRALEELELAG